MAYPDDLDNLQDNYNGTDEVDIVDHAGMHNDERTAINALESKVGIDGSVDVDSLDYKLKNSASINPGHRHTESAITDLDKYTQTQTNNLLAGKSNIGHTHSASDVTDFNTAADTRADGRITAQKGVNSGLASLDSGGKVPVSQIPATALVNVFTANSQVAQLALTTQEGDVVIRTDESKTYIRNSGTAGNMTDYTQILSPTGGSTAWGTIIGALTDQADLVAALAAKADDTAVVKLTGNQTVAGQKSLTDILKVFNTFLEGYSSGGGSNDALKLKSNNAGASIGVQNTNAAGYAGIEYIDNGGNVQVFTGYNNGAPGEFRFNNIAAGGYIDFKIGGSTRLRIANDGIIQVASDLLVADEAYDDAGWNNDLSVPTKNAVRDVLAPIISKLAFIAVTQAVDLDAIETNSNASKVKTDFIAITQPVDLDQIEADTAANNAKVSNATHTGEVIGSGALTVDKTVISNKSSVVAAVNDTVLIGDTSDSNNLKKVTVQSIIDLGPTSAPYNETPSGTVNGVNTVFTLANTPSNPGTVRFFFNGVSQRNGVDFTVSGNTVTFGSGAQPATGTEIYASYNVVTSASTVNGSTNFAIVTVTANTTLDVTHYTVLVDATAGPVTIALPAVGGVSGRMYNIKKIDSSGNAVTIDPNGSETIDGSTTVSLITQYQARTIHSNGLAWYAF